MIRRIFVYGTLMQGCSNHKILHPEYIEKIEPATIKNMDLYAHKCGVFPCMIEGTGTVVGELITLKRKHFFKVLRSLDRLEGYNGKDNPENLYNRVCKTIVYDVGIETRAFVYLYNMNFPKGLGTKIETGNFKLYLKTKGENKYEFKGYFNKNQE